MIFKSRKDCENFLKGTWDKLKEDLKYGRVLYNDTESLLKYTFFEQFDNMFGYMYEDNTVEIRKIREIYRGVNCSTYDFDRFIPSEQYSNLNRFNPPGEVFIYLGVSLDETISTSNIERGCIKEMRLGKGDEVSFCKFIPSNKQVLDNRVVDLTIGDDKTYDQLLHELEGPLLWRQLSTCEFNEEYTNKCMEYKCGCVYSTAKILMKIYNKMISEKIFLPVDGLDREEEYRPFHAFANYFREKGYAGILYKSTVSPGNKNLVLFNVNDVEPTGEIKRIKVSY